MRMPRPIVAWFLCGTAIAACLAADAFALDFGGANDITAVSSRASRDYVRAKNPDGTFVPEYYAFAEGGPWKGAGRDASIDNLTFLDVAHVVAYPLADQNYLPCKDAMASKLLLMVYWGTTHADDRGNESVANDNLQDKGNKLKTATQERDDAFKVVHGNPLQTLIYDRAYQNVVDAAQAQMQAAIGSATAENAVRDQNDLLNVKMLGYDSWWNATLGGNQIGTPLATQRQDMINEIEDNRYFVILMAYDFQLLWKKKQHKLLWETRFSIRQLHHQFDKDLPAMAKYASQYFGRDSGGLIHAEVPMGHVEIGDVKSLGTVPGK
jgi:hypothetical protein